MGPDKAWGANKIWGPRYRSSYTLENFLWSLVYSMCKGAVKRPSWLMKVLEILNLMIEMCADLNVNFAERRSAATALKVKHDVYFNTFSLLFS